MKPSSAYIELSVAMNEKVSTHHVCLLISNSVRLVRLSGCAVESDCFHLDSSVPGQLNRFDYVHIWYGSLIGCTHWVHLAVL